MMFCYGSRSWDILLKKIFISFGEILNVGRTLMIHLSMEKIMEAFWCREYIFLLATTPGCNSAFLSTVERIRLSSLKDTKFSSRFKK